jgi:SAM-dependent methyltransferase
VSPGSAWPSSEQEWLNRFVPDHDYQQNVYAAELGREVEPGCRWLDLGTGSRVHRGWASAGHGVIPASELSARARLLVGADFETGHMRENRHLHARVAADGNRLPFRSGGFDLVTANMVVEHLEWPERTFGEVHRVLRPGGRFLFVTPNRGYPIVWLSALLAGSRSRRLLASRVEGRALEHVFETHYRCNSAGAVRRVAVASGFTVRRLRLFNSYPFFRRPLAALLAEGAWIRLTSVELLAGWRSNLVAVLERLDRTRAA